jgi:DNA-binding MarR family transcriptional regulator
MIALAYVIVMDATTITQPPERGRRLLDLILFCRKSCKDLARWSELSVEEFLCLGLLYVHPPASVKELSRSLGVNASQTSRILRTLENKGLISRSLNVADRRVEDVTLTPRGLRVVERLLDHAEDVAMEATAIASAVVAEPPAG